MTSNRKFPNDPQAVRAARKFALHELSGYAPELLDTVELLVSELAGNCVRHTSSNFEVSVASARRRIRVSVSDRGAGTPAVQHVDSSAVAGRGLALVETLSSSWGVRASRLPRGGKVVWFELDLDDERARARMVA
ncbi:MAG TPA: ATP-binding protein [Solirubrobacteraceae bacterium]|jgi:anti-sigma regulatory factor (Ser/Thr protein kinase)|nr:ATP-binding protein [Solirubrobacteraceae bacterium]